MKKLFGIMALTLCALGITIGMAACEVKKTDDAYTVSFNLNYADAPEAQLKNFASGEKIAKPTDPTRDGYVFDKWYTETICINEYDFNTTVTHSFALFAGWTQTSFTVSYNTGAGSAVADTALGTNQTLTKPADPKREGYTFGGWYTDSLFRNEYDFSQKVEEDLTLYAKWVQHEATVSFHLYDNVTAPSKNVEIGQKLTLPLAPTREDYEFEQWYTDAQKTKPYDVNKTVEGDFTLYAGWKLVNATVTFNYNYDECPEATSMKVKVDTIANAPQKPNRDGYDFTGWYLDAEEKDKFEFETTAVKENMNLYAGWKLKEYLVTFDWNFVGSTPVSDTIQHGKKASAPTENVPTNGNLVLVGWTTDKEGKNSYDFNSTVGAPLTLYAKWAAPSSDKITVTYYLNNGTQDVHYTDTTATQGRRLTAPADPVRAGYYFAGWEKADGTLWNFGQDFVQSSLNLNARWLKGYNFEAEYTDLSGKIYHGWSNDGEATAGELVAGEDRFTNPDVMKISGGALVWQLLYNGASLEFKIHAEKAVSNAVLVLRITPDGYNYELDDESYQVIVNGKRLEYGHLCMHQADNLTELEKTAFTNYVMTLNLELKAGDNTIQLLTNNVNEHGGTYNAETPLVDCMTIYASTTLKWSDGECHPENVGKTMSDVNYEIIYEGDFNTDRDHADCLND